MKFNTIWTGLLIGILLPIVAMGFMFLFAFKNLSFSDFFMMVKKMDILTQTLTICVMPSFFAFFFFYWRQHNRAAHGVTLATIFLVIAVVILTA